jgi:pimeloyl-ACP methyl ester carboxylesterase
LNPIPLVLLPGLEGSGTLFADFVAELPPEIHPIVAPYPRGTFLPYSELVHWLAGIVPSDRPFALLGESYGSPLAVQFAATHPPNLTAVILTAGFISNPVRRLGPLPWLLSRAPVFRIPPPDLLLEYFVIGFGASQKLKAAVRSASRSEDAAVLARRARAVIGCDARKEIQQIRVPVLYLQAARDRLVRRGSLEEINRLHPETVAVSIPTAHLLLQRQPQLAAKTIAAFLKARF